ncbi:hypothetical protein JYU34_011632 [Plutella xylostella]|uniref:Secreted protein n=1 Tax=Plutella xylostella TaxID=51655 RepID=A0ABQ7QD80_PLUXY|nr:hypothetical protein JYU34_011632 [Plutella xylostella]
MDASRTCAGRSVLMMAIYIMRSVVLRGASSTQTMLPMSSDHELPSRSCTHHVISNSISNTTLLVVMV